MRFSSKKSMIVPVTLFIFLVILDGYISYTAIELNLAYELNPLYYHFGDFFWLIKSACSLFVIFIAMRMYNQHPFLTLRAMYVCSAIMSLVVIWNIIQVTLFA
jgi:hypothetical protein